MKSAGYSTLCIVFEGVEMATVGATSKGKERMVEPEMVNTPGSVTAEAEPTREIRGTAEQDWEVKPYKIHVSI